MVTLSYRNPKRCSLTLIGFYSIQGLRVIGVKFLIYGNINALQNTLVTRMEHDQNNLNLIYTYTTSEGNLWGQQMRI